MLAICAFIYGLTGMSLALIGMYYFMIQDWPMNIGGKPNYYMYQNSREKHVPPMQTNIILHNGCIWVFLSENHLIQISILGTKE